jgi:hypothetical protein
MNSIAFRNATLCPGISARAACSTSPCKGEVGAQRRVGVNHRDEADPDPQFNPRAQSDPHPNPPPCRGRGRSRLAERGRTGLAGRGRTEFVARAA